MHNRRMNPTSRDEDFDEGEVEQALGVLVAVDLRDLLKDPPERIALLLQVSRGLFQSIPPPSQPPSLAVARRIPKIARLSHVA